MITLYSGTPGSGKSLHLARYIHDRLVYDRCVVIANFEFNWQAIKEKKRGVFLSIDNDRMTPKRLIRFARDHDRVRFRDKRRKEGRYTLVIDEAQILFNAREWNLANRAGWTSFFTQHRKYGYDVILIAQFDRMLDRQIRSLIEYEVIHRKVNNYGWFGKILGLLSGGALFAAVKMWYPMKERVGAEFFLARKKYYSLYDTFKMFDA